MKSRIKLLIMDRLNILLLRNLDNFTARLAKANSASKNDTTNFVKMTDFDKPNNLN